MIISIIVAIAKNKVIGNDNKLIWRLSDDLKRFKRLTTGHTILMGRKTYESIGRPLPKRKNYIITRSKEYVVDGGYVFHSIGDAIEAAKEEGEDELFIIGGGEIYKEMLPMANKMYLTKVHANPKGDTFFPKFDEEEWDIINDKAHLADEKNEYNFVFIDLERR